MFLLLHGSDFWWLGTSIITTRLKELYVFMEHASYHSLCDECYGFPRPLLSVLLLHADNEPMTKAKCRRQRGQQSKWETQKALGNHIRHSSEGCLTRKSCSLLNMAERNMYIYICISSHSETSPVIPQDHRFQLQCLVLTFQHGRRNIIMCIYNI